MGEFSERVRRGKVTGPRKRTFSLAAWKKAFEEVSPSDRTDTALYASGRFIHSKLAAIRKAIEESSLSRLSTETLTLALVAAANHQYEALELQMEKRLNEGAGEDGSRELHARDLGTTQVSMADGITYNANAALSSMLDGIAIPLRVALMGSGSAAATKDSFTDVGWGHVQLEMNLGVLYGQAESLWEDCVWNTYIIGGADNQTLALPIDVDAKRGVHAATARKVVLGMEAVSYAVRALQLHQAQGLAPRVKGVQAVLYSENGQRIVLGEDKLDPHSLAMLFALRMMACPPYYDALIDEPQELLAGATLSQLFDSWMVVSHAARRLWDAAASTRQADSPTDHTSPVDMREYVPFFTREALIAAVHEAAGLSVDGAAAVIEFLTFRGQEKQEFWTQPLVATGHPSRLYPIIGALKAPPDLRFALERWMAQLRIKLEDRGPAFEHHMRETLVKAAAKSPILSKVANVVPRDYTFRCADGAFGQIDGLFCIGSRVFVLEMKCILEPTDATSVGTHRSAIAHASDQAKDRATLIEQHPEEFVSEMKQFGWDLPSEFRVHPLVAVSTVAHVGISLNGVPVVDELVLGKFFEGGYDDVGLDTGNFSVVSRVHHPFYSNADEAQVRAALYFENPPQLAQYSDGLYLRKVPIYAVSEDDWYGWMLDFEQR